LEFSATLDSRYGFSQPGADAHFVFDRPTREKLLDRMNNEVPVVVRMQVERARCGHTEDETRRFAANQLNVPATRMAGSIRHEVQAISWAIEDEP
jgi:hypothetical protein